MQRVLRVTLVTALGALLAACSMFGSESADPLDDLRAKIAETVLDTQRAETMLESVDRLDELLLDSADIVAAAGERERELFRDYDSTPGDYQAFIAAAGAERGRIQQQILDVHLAMKSSATPGEWDAIRPVQIAAVAARVESLVAVARPGS